MLKTLTVSILLLTFAAGAFAEKNNKTKPASGDSSASITIVFKDGRQQSFSLADVARIDFPAVATSPSEAWPAHFAGKWKVGDGMGGTFYITLYRDGHANKTINAAHGTWTVLGEEVRISWDDGWHDVIRKTEAGYEKVAFSPGKSFTDDPNNVASAKRTEPI